MMLQSRLAAEVHSKHLLFDLGEKGEAMISVLLLQIFTISCYLIVCKRGRRVKCRT